jgi:hypothetical protein
MGEMLHIICMCIREFPLGFVGQWSSWVNLSRKSSAKIFGRKLATLYGGKCCYEKATLTTDDAYFLTTYINLTLLR